ncbi:MAG: serine hydrolase domain-containing protein [Saprospiraceae bacterium]
MKAKTIVSLLLALLVLGACQKDIYVENTGLVGGDLPVNPDHPMADSLKVIVQKHLDRGVPGVQVIVKNSDGWYVVNGGYAKIEDETPIQDNMTAWLYSISKVYTAALCMKMKERGLLNLDAAITDYLPADISRRLSRSQDISVRMLLNHSSGLPNFTITNGYFLTQLNAPFAQPDPLAQLAYIYDKPLLFDPGTDFFYSNTNYMLLQLILEKVSGRSWNTLVHEEIIEPLGLTHTYYPVSDEQLVSLGFPNYYFERFNNGQLENCTRWHNRLAQSLVGYGGLAANGADVILFYQALLDGLLVTPESLDEMRAWIQGKTSTEPDYGLGLEYYEYLKGTPTYGHEGDCIGGTTQILYVPSRQTYLFITINAGRQLYGQYLFRTSDLKIDLCRYVSRP